LSCVRGRRLRQRPIDQRLRSHVPRLKEKRINERLHEELAQELDRLQDAGTYKRFNTLCSPQGPVVQMEGRGEVLVLSSNNYLGLASHPEVVRGGIDGLEDFGAGTASVRFICGTFKP